MVILRVPIRACAKARPRVTRYGTFMPKSYMLWREEFKSLAGGQYRGDPITEPVRLTVTYRNPKGKLRGDLDNCVGAVSDALQTWLIANDRQVVELHGYVVKGDQEIEINIERMP